MKKVLYLLLAVLMAVSLCACGSDDSQEVLAETETASAAEEAQVSYEPAVEETAVSESEETTDSYYPVTITTYNYAQQPIELTFEQAPEKVFAVYQDSIETLLALGLADKIAACAGLDQDVKEEYQESFESVNYLTEFSPDKESVIMLEPDFILSWYSYFSEKRLGDVDYWHENGINTYIMLNSGAAEERCLENEYTDILNLGVIFNVQEKAEALVEEMKTEVEKAAAAASESGTSPTVLVMEFEDDGLRVYGDNTLGGDMVTQLGATLVTAAENHMSSEELLTTDPDVIFTVYFGSSDSIADADAAIAKFFEDPMYASLSAVENENVCAISLGEMYCSGTRTLDGILRLAEGIYPELYS